MMEVLDENEAGHAWNSWTAWCWKGEEENERPRRDLECEIGMSEVKMKEKKWVWSGQSYLFEYVF